MLIALYPIKKALKDAIGNTLEYRETSYFGLEYDANGTFSVCNRPSLAQGYKRHGRETVREFFASVTMSQGKIAKVE